MKIWFGYGSEHSMNLVMIGRFKDAASAERAKQVVDLLTAQVADEVGAGQIEVGQHPDGYSQEMQALLREVDLFTVGPAELEQFVYDVSVSVDGADVVVSTDEIEVSAFLKTLLDHGARVEVFSAHAHPGSGHGRGA